jgi:DNA-binding NtrC family response regulator
MGVSVLFVDDDLDLRDAMRDIFDYLGGVPCVLAASLGELQAQPSAALECRLAIVDINLGDGQPSGVDVVQWLRGHGFRGKIVFLTGHGQGDPHLATAANVADTKILSKPLAADDLARLLDDARGRP